MQGAEDECDVWTKEWTTDARSGQRGQRVQQADNGCKERTIGAKIERWMCGVVNGSKEETTVRGMDNVCRGRRQVQQTGDGYKKQTTGAKNEHLVQGTDNGCKEHTMDARNGRRVQGMDVRCEEPNS